ncbi:MAG: permease [Peptococcaceae bacterium]|jgi:uncharacterized membrane protein YraQ (UPF0718 family)|nr:permease [Peptococcaceae bacterium]MDH7525051.1 permease [Peptococcaceae bacterium]
MKAELKRYRWFFLLLVIDLLLAAYNPDEGRTVFKHTSAIFLQMLGVLPPIFLILGLLDTWVPRETVIRHLGEESGIKGIGLSFLLGAAAAGPLYAAFPIAALMAQKGVKYRNIIIFLGAWSTMKIPMFLFELTSLGSRFAVTRLLFNVPGILLMAWLVDRVVGEAEKESFYRRHS